MKNTPLISLLLRITIAIIFAQTLYFKFTAHPDSVYIFSQLGVEPFGRIGLGIAELITCALLLIPRTKIIGIFISLGIISGAILSHFIVIGTDIMGDGGGLLALAFVVLAACIILFFIHKKEIQHFTKTTFHK